MYHDYLITLQQFLATSLYFLDNKETNDENSNQGQNI